jgi:hypothetical protein
MAKSTPGSTKSVTPPAAAAAPAATTTTNQGTPFNREIPTTTPEESSLPSSSSLYSWAWVGMIGYVMSLIIYNAYRIRMGAIDEFGPVIHEFDPYFNYRATEVRVFGVFRRFQVDLLWTFMYIGYFAGH